MYGRFFNMTVGLLWVSSMIWLVTQKMLPTLRIGEPPSYQTILEAQKEDPLVGWKLYLNNREIGWALSRTERHSSGIVEIDSYVHFERLPINELIPRPFRGLFHDLRNTAEKVSMQTRSCLTIDPLGRLLRFDSAVDVNSIPDVIRLSGVVEGSQMELQVRSGGLSFPKPKIFPLPPKALLGDALSPQSHLPNLRTGQSWTVPVFNPLRPDGDSVEFLQATVEEPELIEWRGHIIKTSVVVYRFDSGYGISQKSAPQSILWVREDGLVLKQQVALFESIKMVFVRMRQYESQSLAEQVLDAEL
ncbi:MAG: hypothetical protein JXB10_02705 [Pirellulales bacterium]|nr:hypothetical protein [Pirellulales bacterium]